MYLPCASPYHSSRCVHCVRYTCATGEEHFSNRQHGCCGGPDGGRTRSRYAPHMLEKAVDRGLRILWSGVGLRSTDANQSLTAKSLTAKSLTATGLESLTRGTGGSALLTAISACEGVTIYGSGLLRLSPPRPLPRPVPGAASSPPIPSFSSLGPIAIAPGRGKSNPVRAPRADSQADPPPKSAEAGHAHHGVVDAGTRPQLVYAHAYDGRVARCTTEQQALDWASRHGVCQFRVCREEKAKWWRDRMGTELVLHVLHSFGMVTWRW